jgi:hypothetical protein
MIYCSEDVAKEVLKNFGGKIDEALDHYFSNSHLYTKNKGTSTKTIDKAKLEAIFAKHVSEEDPDALFDEFLRNYLTAIGVDPSSRDALHLFYKLGAKNAGELTKDEFVNGWTSYGVDTVDGMKTEAAKSATELQNEPELKEFYKWIFNYLKENKKSRTIRKRIQNSRNLSLTFSTAKGLGVALWSICLDSQRFPLLGAYKDFLNVSPEKRNFLIFLMIVGAVV